MMHDASRDRLSTDMLGAEQRAALADLLKVDQRRQQALALAVDEVLAAAIAEEVNRRSTLEAWQQELERRDRVGEAHQDEDDEGQSSDNDEPPMYIVKKG